MVRNTNGKGFSLKDNLFNKEKVQYLAELFSAADTTFKGSEFTDEVMKSLLDLELKQRVVCITKALETQLPKNFKKACTVIVRALPPELDPTKSDDDFGDFIYAPLGEYMVRNGLNQKDLDTSLQTIKEITKRFSMEDSIRYFINAFPNETMKEMGKWVTDDNYHVRRLISEGTRPLLPWSGRIGIDQLQTLPLLNLLYTDPTRYVTRSVANHMNDISKIDPLLVTQTLIRWKEEEEQDPKELDWMIRHSLRTLLKKGDKNALLLLGYNPNAKIKISDTVVQRRNVSIGETLDFSFSVTATADELLMVDYVIDFVKANCQTKPKVFKLSKKSIKKGETLLFEKKHRLLADATTFKLYPGQHTLTLQINGKKFNPAVFEIN